MVFKLHATEIHTGEKLHEKIFTGPSRFTKFANFSFTDNSQYTVRATYVRSWVNKKFVKHLLCILFYLTTNVISARQSCNNSVSSGAMHLLCTIYLMFADTALWLQFHVYCK